MTSHEPRRARVASRVTANRNPHRIKGPPAPATPRRAAVTLELIHMQRHAGPAARQVTGRVVVHHGRIAAGTPARPLVGTNRRRLEGRLLIPADVAPSPTTLPSKRQGATPMISTLPYTAPAPTDAAPGRAVLAADSLTATADVVLDSHHDDGSGMCAGCQTHYGQLKPAPCTQAWWAANVTESRDTSATSSRSGAAIGTTEPRSAVSAHRPAGTP